LLGVTREDELDCVELPPVVVLPVGVGMTEVVMVNTPVLRMVVGTLPGPRLTVENTEVVVKTTRDGLGALEATELVGWDWD